MNIDNYLTEDETVQSKTSAKCREAPHEYPWRGTLVATDKRLLFVGNNGLVEFPLDEVRATYTGRTPPERKYEDESVLLGIFGGFLLFGSFLPQLPSELGLMGLIGGLGAIACAIGLYMEKTAEEEQFILVTGSGTYRFETENARFAEILKTIRS